jgi:glutamate-1-semialdehyde 2,1-aminomutase
MRLGGLGHTDRPRVFLLSTTHGAESHALAAAVATMRVYRDEPVIEHICAMGEALRDGVRQAIDRHDLHRHVQVIGRPCCLAYATLDRHGLPSQAFRSLLLQETIRRGILAPSLVVSYSHGPDDIAAAVDAIDGSLNVYRRALEDGVEAHLVGRPSQLVYSSHNAPGYP